MDIYVLDGGAPVIKVGDVCYELVGLAEEPPNAVAEDTYQTCEECEASSSDLSGSSEAPSSSFSSEVSSDVSSEVSSDVSSEAPSSEASSLEPHVIVTTYNVSYECSTGAFGIVSKNNTTCHPEDPGDLIAFNQWFWLNNSPAEGGGACAFVYHATEFTSCNPSGGPFADVPAPGDLPDGSLIDLCLCPSEESSVAPSDTCGEPTVCGTPNGDPTIQMTLTWPLSDPDETKSWLGCTWCRGQTKTVYADSYDLRTGGTYSAPIAATFYWELWRKGPDSVNADFRMVRGGSKYYTFYYYGAAQRLRIIGGTDKRDSISSVKTSGGSTYTGPYLLNSELGILNLGDMPTFPSDYKLLGKQKSNSYTDANNITYTWTASW